MKTLVVGNSLEVLPVIENIFSQNKEEQVTLFATEGVLPYDRSALPSLVAAAATEKVLYKTSEIFLAAYRSVVLTSETLARVSVRRKYLTTEKKTQIGYDRLVVVDTGSLIFPPVKGHHRTGVFDCWRLSSVKAMMKYLLLSDNVTVAVSNIQGLNMACALSSLKKEVMVISSTQRLLPGIFDEETGLLLKQILEGKGIRVFSENAIEEILGDAEVKAVKLRSGKVLACDAVIFDEVKVDLRMFSEPLPDQERIDVEASFRTSVLPFEPKHFGFNVLDGFYAGYTQMPEGGREYLKFDGPQNIFKKMFVLNDQIAGLVVFNAPQDREGLLGVFQRKENITGHEEEIL
jgi:NAD(P)H-nitrite reductase large subunit